MATRKIGERWEKTTKGVVYIMEKMPDGKILSVGRKTPYVMPSRANNKSNPNLGHPERKKLSKSRDDLPNMPKLAGSEKIYIAENARRQKVLVKLAHNKWALRYPEDVDKKK